MSFIVGHIKRFQFCRLSLTAFIQRSKRRKRVIRTLGSSGLRIARFEQPSSVTYENILSSVAVYLIAAELFRIILQ